MPHYFAYGSNLSRARLEARVGAVRVVGRAQLEAYRHRFSKLGRDGTAKGNIEQNRDTAVWGVIYDLDGAQHERLIEFESGYRQSTLEVRNDRGELIRITSFEANKIISGILPTAEYLAHYVNGMREHRLPAKYQAEVLLGLEHLIPDIERRDPLLSRLRGR